MKLEEELRRALARKDPPKDFSARVAARIHTNAAARPTVKVTTRRRLIGLAMAATLAIGTASTLYVAHQREAAAEAERVSAERGRAERLQNEAVTGLRIASAKLNEVHDRLLAQMSSRSEQNERSR